MRIPSPFVGTDIKRKLNFHITCLLLALKQYCKRVHSPTII